MKPIKNYIKCLGTVGKWASVVCDVGGLQAATGRTLYIAAPGIVSLFRVRGTILI